MDNMVKKMLADEIKYLILQIAKTKSKYMQVSKFPDFFHIFRNFWEFFGFFESFRNWVQTCHSQMQRMTVGPLAVWPFKRRLQKIYRGFKNNFLYLSVPYIKKPYFFLSDDWGTHNNQLTIFRQRKISCPSDRQQIFENILYRTRCHFSKETV